VWCGNKNRVLRKIVGGKLEVEATGMDLKSITPQTTDSGE
jgi:hypothetical protein